MRRRSEAQAEDRLLVQTEPPAAVTAAGQRRLACPRQLRDGDLNKVCGGLGGTCRVCLSGNVYSNDFMRKKNT